MITSTSTAQPISGHNGRDRWMCALAADRHLSTMAFRLALRLCVSFNCKTGQCDPGYDTLAEDMAVSERSVFRAVAELQAGGWITVHRTGGDNTRRNQFALLVPSAQMTTVVTRSGDNMLSPENPSLQVTENGPSGDKNRGFQVTDSVAAQEPDEPVNLKRTAKPPSYSADAARESATTNSTSDDEIPNQRASQEALVETVETQQQPPRVNPIGTSAANGRAAPAISPFAQVLSIYPEHRVGDEAKAYFVFERALDARGSLSAVLESLASLMQDYGDGLPLLIDLLKTIERTP